MFGNASGDSAGVAVAGAGDLDGDGFDDLVIGGDGSDLGGGQSGVAWLVHGPVSGDRQLEFSTATLVGEGPGDHAGVAVAGVGDTNGDGFADVLIGAGLEDEAGLDAGAAYLVLGPRYGRASLSTADAKLLGAGAGGVAHAGESLASAVDLATADLRLRGSAVDDLSGGDVGGAGDFDHDGFDDLLVGARQSDLGGGDSGVAWLVFGNAL